MKKWRSIAWAAVLAIGLTVPAPAAEYDRALCAAQAEITETVSDSGAITRTLTRSPADREPAEDVLAQTRAELVRLGLDERAVEKMEEDTLQDAARAETIAASVAYYRLGANGGAQMVAESTAQTEAERINKANRQADGVGLRAAGRDGYIKVAAVTYPSDEVNYGYTTAATFTRLTAGPALGGEDVFRVASDNCTFASRDADGYVSYCRKTYSGRCLVSEKEIDVAMSPELYADDSGNVLGIGYGFDLPAARSVSIASHQTDIYADCYDYLLCRGITIDPAQGGFDHTASYDHRRGAAANARILSIAAFRILLPVLLCVL